VYRYWSAQVGRLLGSPGCKTECLASECSGVTECVAQNQEPGCEPECLDETPGTPRWKPRQRKNQSKLKYRTNHTHSTLLLNNQLLQVLEILIEARTTLYRCSVKFVGELNHKWFKYHGFCIIPHS